MLDLLTGVDAASPVDWTHPLNQGRVLWLLGIDGAAGGPALWPDITRRTAGAALVGGPGWAPTGRGDSALATNGAAQYGSVSAPAGSALDIPRSHSVAMWLYATGTASVIPFCRFSWSGPQNDLFVWLQNSSTISYSLTGSTSASGRVDATFPGTVKWFRLVGTYDGATIRLYLNGALASSKSASVAPVGSSEPILIGTDADATGGGGLGNWWPGRIADVSVWTRPLTAGQVALDYSESLRLYPTALRRRSRLVALAPAGAAAAHSGSGTGSLTLGASGAGYAAHSGSGTGALALSGTAVGQAAHSGSGTGSLALGASATGEAGGGGSGTGSLALAATGTGFTARAGSGSGALALAGAAAGYAAHSGSGTGALALAASATGVAGGAAPPAPGRALALAGADRGSAALAGADRGSAALAGADLND